MSLSGCRPAVVRSLSSRNRLPALGPRFTTSREPPPAGSGALAHAPGIPRAPPDGPPPAAPGLALRGCRPGGRHRSLEALGGTIATPPPHQAKPPAHPQLLADELEFSHVQAIRAC